ncbi:MAG: hypothetical protein ACWGQW_04090 [bacterium]
MATSQLYDMQRNFAAGEISPSSWLRNDLGDFHSAAVKTMRNTLPDPHGPFEARGGFEFIEHLEGAEYCRIYDFNVNFSQAYVVAVTPDTLYILDRNGFQASGNLVQNSNFNSGDDGWDHDEVNFDFGLAFMEPRGGANNAWLRQQVITTDESQNHIMRVAGVDNDQISPINIRIGTSAGGSQIAEFLNIPGQRAIVEFTPGVASFWIEVEVEVGNDVKILDSITVRSVTSVSVVEFPSPYDTVDKIRDIQIDLVPGLTQMVLVCRDVAPHYIEFISDNIWVFEPIDFVFGPEGDEPAPWGIAYPGSVSFYDGRMALGGTREQPIHIWMSKPRDYFNFDLGDDADLQPDDALELPLDKHGQIQWLLGGKRLFAGLDTGEHVIYGYDGPITAANATTEQHSAHGSSRVQARMMDNNVIYVDPSGETVYAMDYKDTRDGYVSERLSFQADHINNGRISDLQYTTSPFRQLIFTLLSGDFTVANVDVDQGTLGWSRHDTQGRIMSVAVLEEFGIDIVWFAVQREGGIFIERYDRNHFMDGHKQVSLTPPASSVSGFEHLANQVVQVIADGVVHPDVTITESGILNLNFDATTVVAGLGYESLVETLPQSRETRYGENNTRHKKRYSDIYVYLLDSPRPLINGMDPYLRSPITPMGEREPNETGIVGVANTGWDEASTIAISQPLPLKMVVAGVGGKLTESKL